MASRKPKRAAENPISQLTLPDWRGLLGHDELLRRWRALVQQQRLPQVMLLWGRSGIGKRGLMAALAAMACCTAQPAGCGACESCRWLLHGAHPEVLWLETLADRYTLDDAAVLQDHLSFCAAGRESQRIAVICDADKLNMQAANRLLKILEEPPPGSRILLSTSRPNALLPTILSRCVRWRVDPPAPDTIVPWLLRQAQTLQPDRAFEDSEIWGLLRQVGFSPGLALAELTQLRQSTNNDQRMWASQNFTQALAVAAEAVADSGEGSALARLSAQLDTWEIELNGFYRQLLARREGQDPVALRRRRDALRSARALVQRGKVALNPLLTAESIALAAVQS